MDSRLRGNERGESPASGGDTQRPPAATVDPATLPPIESIGAGTDIRAFLQSGVPSDLTRAALRRAWTSDPAIRDFIGIAENQWDFAAGDIPGFGPLKAIDDVRRMVAELTGDVGKLVEPKPEPKAQTPPTPAESAPAATPEAQVEPQAPEVEPEQKPALASTEEQQTAPHKVNVAMQHEDRQDEYGPVPTRRSHGRALPE